ncbi:MAG: hypothetical protein IRY85_10035 [Micromonosporaceae bacterium]|nr:hypothetical protein [Micromonosporaceae bacterium]
MLRRTSLKRKTPLKSRRRSTGPDQHTVDTVLERDQHSCGVCGYGLSGTRSVDWSIQHRRPRRQGGDPRPDVNLPSNLFAVHGDGTSGCHGRIESHRAEAYSNGWLLHDGDVPSQEAICHAVHGWCYLTDDGRISYSPPPVLVGEEIR